MLLHTHFCYNLSNTVYSWNDINVYKYFYHLYFTTYIVCCKCLQHVGECNQLGINLCEFQLVPFSVCGPEPLCAFTVYQCHILQILQLQLPTISGYIMKFSPTYKKYCTVVMLQKPVPLVVRITVLQAPSILLTVIPSRSHPDLCQPAQSAWY
jgi:hypothetical protein